MMLWLGASIAAVGVGLMFMSIPVLLVTIDSIEKRGHALRHIAVAAGIAASFAVALAGVWLGQVGGMVMNS